MRTAMGASRWRLMRLLLIESAALGLVGGAFGLLVAVWSLDVIHVSVRRSRSVFRRRGSIS